MDNEGYGFRPAAIGTGTGFRTAAIGGPGVIGRGAGVAPGRFANVAPGRFHHGTFHHRFHRRPIFVATGFGLGLYGAYPYDDYYPYSAYNDDGCYVVNRRVYTRYGWRLRPVQVCT